LYSGVKANRRCRYALVGLGASVCLVVFATGATASPLPSPGYRSVESGRLGAGVDSFDLRRGGPAEVVHVARIAHSAPYDLRAIPANGAVGQGLERTSSMCRRTNCLVAVNGDFWNPATAGVPAGAVISLGQVLRSPSDNHDQLAWSPDTGLSAGVMRLKATLVTSDLANVQITTLNSPVGPGGIGAYTRSWGPVSGTTSDFEIVLERVEGSGPPTLSRTLLVTLADGHEGGAAAIPSDGLVLSGRGSGAARLERLWSDVQDGKVDAQALVRMQSTPEAVESVGGSPVLLRNGQRVFDDVASSLVRQRHPRTIVGRTSTGDVLLVTVDGRQPGYSNGMTLAEAADLMKSLGAVDALNLDGGGSSTFVVKGKVLNQPSDRAIIRHGKRMIVHIPSAGDNVLGLTERPVATALAVVPRAPSARVTATGVLGEFETAAPDKPAEPYATDPASDPSGTLPAIVVPAKSHFPVRPVGAAVLVAALLLAAMFHPRIGRVRVRFERAH